MLEELFYLYMEISIVNPRGVLESVTMTAVASMCERDDLRVTAVREMSGEI